MATWPTTPIPLSVTEEPIADPTIIGEFEGGYEVRRSRWHRAKKEFILTYRALQSGDAPTQAIADFTIIRDFLVARRLQTETFTFGHPYYANSVYVCRYGMETLPQRRLVRTDEDNGTDIWELVVRVKEVF